MATKAGLISDFKNDNTCSINYTINPSISNVNILHNIPNNKYNNECRCKCYTIYQIVILMLLKTYSCGLSTYNFIYKMEYCHCDNQYNNHATAVLKTDASTETPTTTPSQIPPNIPTEIPTTMKPFVSPTNYNPGLKLYLFPSSNERFHVTDAWNWRPKYIDLSEHNLPDNTQAIHGTVYMYPTHSNCFIVVMGTLPLCTENSCSLWSENYYFGGNSSNWDNSDNVMLNVFNDYGGNGRQYTSLTIPITSDKKLYWSMLHSSGNSPSLKFILFVRGYYAP